jgi:GTPase SAR1 family protein
VLRNHTSVLAGPSGAGKSSIINYLRQVSFDKAQSARLARFHEAMSEEYDWRMCESDADTNAEDSNGSARASNDTTEPGGPSGPSSVAQTHSSHIRLAGQEHDRMSESAVPALEQGAGQTEQQKWKKKSGDIYGAQVSSVLSCRQCRLNIPPAEKCHICRLLTHLGLCGR